MNNNAESDDMKTKTQHDHDTLNRKDQKPQNVVDDMVENLPEMATNEAVTAVKVTTEAKPKQQLKAKILRQQRKAEKLMAKSSMSIETDHKVVTKKMPKNVEKNFKSLIEEIPTDQKHKLKVCKMYLMMYYRYHLN